VTIKKLDYPGKTIHTLTQKALFQRKLSAEEWRIASL
jgi:hypothetical protein